MDKCCALAHRLPTLAALAPTSSPLLQQQFMRKMTATAPASSRNPPSSQEIRLRNNQVKSHGGATRENAKQHVAFRPIITMSTIACFIVFSFMSRQCWCDVS